MATTWTLERQQWIPRPIDEVFAFFSNALNLERLTPPWLKFQVLTPPEAMKAGTLIDYKLKVHGIPMRWRSEITVWEPPFRFVDKQLRGPYRVWIHEHRFEAKEGGTLVFDTVQYGVPGGALVRKLLVAPDLERIFRYRQDELARIFGSGTR